MNNNQKQMLFNKMFFFYIFIKCHSGIKFYQLRTFCIKIIFYYFSMIKNKIKNYRPGIYLRKLNFHTRY